MYPHILHIYGPVWINSYGLMIAVGFLLCALLAYRHPWRKAHISADTYMGVLCIGVLSAVVGGRLLFAILHPPTTYQQLTELFYPWVEGFSLFGAIIGIILGITCFLKRNRIPILPSFDMIALYAPLLQSISKVGCFLAGCCYGAPVSPSFPLAVTFTNSLSHAPRNIPLHPTQLYSSIASLLIFLLLLAISRKVRNAPGATTLIYLLLASLSRFIVDFWRGDRAPGISSMQWIVAGLFVCALFGLILVRRFEHVEL
jgi:phosphatidylglycerol:prolipoprotein diacylglycerol transferase